MEWLLTICWPFLSFVGNYLKPGWIWFTGNVYDFRHIEFMFENLTMENVTNGTLSRHIRKNDTRFLNTDPFKQDIFNDPFNPIDLD
jgi:hypothetical protein